MQIIDDNKMKLAFPKSLLNIDEMDKDAKDYYKAIYSEYMELLYKYIIKNTDILKYDNAISEKNIAPIEDEYKNFYQSFSINKLKYYYIRNNIHVERLTKEELDFVQEKLLEFDDVFDEKAEEFIKKSYKKMIYEVVSEKDNDSYLVFYKDNEINYSAPVNALVFGVSIEYPFDNLEKLDIYEKNKEMISEMNEDLKATISKQLNNNVNAFIFESVYKKKVNNEMSL